MLPPPVLAEAPEELVRLPAAFMDGEELLLTVPRPEEPEEEAGMAEGAELRGVVCTLGRGPA